MLRFGVNKYGALDVNEIILIQDPPSGTQVNININGYGFDWYGDLTEYTAHADDILHVYKSTNNSTWTLHGSGGHTLNAGTTETVNFNYSYASGPNTTTMPQYRSIVIFDFPVNNYIKFTIDSAAHESNTFQFTANLTTFNDNGLGWQVKNGEVHSFLVQEDVIFSVQGWVDPEDPNCCDAVELAEENCGGLGCFIPQCTDDCEWESMQCWSSSGYCWCVDEDGNEIDGTSQPTWQGYPECEEEIICIQGDLTNDGDVNVLDVVSMVNIILQLPTEGDPWDFWLCAGDFNGDGNINVLDVISLVNLILNPTPEECNIIPEIDPCDGICPTYYYNQDNGQCEEFITGCCGGGVFNTQQSCQDSCE